MFQLKHPVSLMFQSFICSFSFLFLTVSSFGHYDDSDTLAHAGLFWCFHCPPNSDMDYRIFNVPMWSHATHARTHARTQTHTHTDTHTHHTHTHTHTAHTHTHTTITTTKNNNNKRRRGGGGGHTRQCPHSGTDCWSIIVHTQCRNAWK